MGWDMFFNRGIFKDITKSDFDEFKNTVAEMQKNKLIIDSKDPSMDIYKKRTAADNILELRSQKALKPISNTYSAPSGTLGAVKSVWLLDFKDQCKALRNTRAECLVAAKQFLRDNKDSLQKRVSPGPG